MSVHPFAGFNPRPSAWGYNWTQDTQPQQIVVNHHAPEPPPPQPTSPVQQYANLPAALLSTLKREKKPFTYTPGGVNLNEVLNARLQKRIERKKKYSEEKRVETPPKQVVVMPTYNTPLDMYSMENALEALEVQAELVAADKSLSVPSPRSATLPRNHTFRFEDNNEDLDGPRGVTQSKAFRVLQIITDTEEGAGENGRMQHKDEMRFKGLRDSSAIPSKFFHTLQKITGTESTEDEEEERERESRVARPQHFQPTPRPQSFPQPQRQEMVSATADPRGSPVTVLKRPAAFLPIKTSPGFRPVQPSRPMANGRIAGQHRAGTDF